MTDNQIDQATSNPVEEIATAVHADLEFRKALGDDPRRALVDMDIPVPEDVTLQVHVNSDETFHVVFPPDPNEALFDEALDGVSGGACNCFVSTAHPNEPPVPYEALLQRYNEWMGR